ncbi:6569_t:CDS:2 [Entrophospora sp. SA101]|nr:6569_t:CDS:2 [Entrophospora sp. SA101]
MKPSLNERIKVESDFDPDKGSFKQFLCYLPKQNRDILVELFDICAQVTAESHINNMPVERLVKTLALCILGDKDKPLEGFEGAYNEWTKCSQACLHLFLAYLREKAVSTELNPRLTILIDNYVEDRKKSVTSVYFKASNTESDDASHKMKQEPITPSKIFRTQSTTSINELAKEQEEKGYEEKYDGDLLLGFKSGVTEQDKTLLGNSRTRTTNQDFQKQHEQISSHQEKLTSTIPHLLSHSRTNVDNSLPIDDDQLKEWIGDILKDREFPQFVSRVERLLKEKFMGYEM